jgi:acyl-coenzyme A thioesterase PaaI-like protein
MDVTRLPFNQHVGLAPGDEPHLLQLPAAAHLANHLGTVHASAQFALAEATSGQFLLNAFPELQDNALAVVRSFSGKFRAAANGTLHSTASIADEAREKLASDLEQRRRAFVTVEVEVRDASGALTLAASCEWFIQLGA